MTVVCALLAVLLFPHALWAQDIDDLKKGVVKITAQIEGQQPKVGTGFIVRLERDAAYIVTASHVIEGDPKPQITFFLQPQQPFTAQVIGIESESQRGLASLRVSGHMGKFPRSHRFVLGDRIESRMLAVLEALVLAAYAREKKAHLQQANGNGQVLRLLVRAGKDQRATAPKHLTCDGSA